MTTSTIRPISKFSRDSTLVPNWLLQRTDLGPAKRLAVIGLLMHEQQGTTPTVDELAAFLCYSSGRNAQLVLNELRRAGIVQTRSQLGDLSTHEIHNPHEPAHEPGGGDRGITPRSHDHPLIVGSGGDRGIGVIPRSGGDPTITPPASRGSRAKAIAGGGVIVGSPPPRMVVVDRNHWTLILLIKRLPHHPARRRLRRWDCISISTKYLPRRSFNT